jgi:hypothetical protein
VKRAFIALGAALNGCALLAQPGRATNPRLNVSPIWDDRELRAITLPPAVSEGRILYLPADAYYRLRPLTIYKSYPVYDIGREPKHYFEWLRRQAPKVLLDGAKALKPAEWSQVGRMVFEAPTDFAPAEMIHDRAWFQRVRPPVTKDGVVPAYTYVIREKGKVEVGTGSCATCHSRVLDDGTYVPGAQGNFPVERAYAETLRRENRNRVLPRLTGGLLLPATDVARWTERLYERSNEEVIAVSEAMIPGVAMRSGFSYLDPPKIADLIGVSERRYLDLTVRLEHRSLADIARYGSMCWASNYFFSSEETVSAKAISSVSETMRYSDGQAYAFATYVYSLRPPRNPNLPSDQTRRGESIFKREGCPTCHTPPLFTNNKILPAGAFEPAPEHRSKYDILDIRVGIDSAAATNSLRGRGYYKVPSLKGVWYRGPFTHNGTIATLEDWFDPKRLQRDYIPTGYRAHGVDHRPIPGHLFGLSLKPEEKTALIAFLRTL